MTPARLISRRARAHARLLVLVLLQVALTTAAVTGATGYVSTAIRAGLGETLEGPGGSLRVQTGLSEDPRAQRDAAAAVLDEHLAALPVTVRTWTASAALPAVRGTVGGTVDGTGGPGESLGADVTLWADPSLPGTALLEDGAWPTAADETAVHAAAAAHLGLSPGDVVTLTGDADATVALTVTGTWLPRDPADPRWSADPLAAQGADDDGATAGPFVVTPECVADLPATRYARWTLAPDPAALAPDDVGRLRQGLAGATAALRDDDTVEVGGMSVTGDLTALLATAEGRLGGIRGVTTAAVMLVVLTGLIALSQMARLLADVRLPETVLLRSRGTSVRQLVVASVAESAAVAVTGAGLGATAAWGVLTATQAGRPPVAGTVATAIVAAALGVGVLSRRAASQAIGVVRRGRTDPAGRGRRAVRVGGLVAALVAAVLAWWQLDRYGSPVFTDTSGLVRVDPLAAAAVALGLLGVALAATVLLVPATSAGARGAQRRRDLMPVLTLRELARHTPVHAVTVVLVVLAAGAATVVGAYAGTLDAWRADVARAATGADVAVWLVTAPAGGVPVASAALGAHAVDTAVPVRVLNLRAGGSTGELVAVGRGLRLGPEIDAVAGELAGASPDGPALPGNGGALRLTATVDAGLPESPGLTARVWLADAAGELVALDGVPDGEGTWTAQVPGGAWTLAAVDVTVDAMAAGSAVAVEVTGLEVGGTDLLPGVPHWSAYTFAGEESSRHETTGAAVTLDRDDAERSVGHPVRLIPAHPAEAAAAPLPVVVTSGWRAGYDVALGSRTTMRLSGHDIEVTVVGETAVVPGSTPARVQVIPGADRDGTGRLGVGGAPGGESNGADALAAVADLAAVNRMLLTMQADVPAPDAVWADVSAEPAEVAQQVADAVSTDEAGGTTRAVARRESATPAPDQLSEPARVATWLAVACAAVVMVPGVASTALALTLTRRREAAVLRALGVGPRQQARARGAELTLVCAAAVAAGVVGGLGVAWLCVGHLVRATAPGPPALAVTPTPQVLATAGAVATVVVLLGVVVVGFAAAVGRQVRSATRVADER